jgi:hypothetical protein
VCYGVPATCSTTNITTGLIRFKLVIHAFVDGFSRYVTGIQVVNNNRGATVLELFHRARAQHGTPSRVRGDHGVENTQVAAAMAEIRGAGRGSYIWGRYSCLFGIQAKFDGRHRSIHNTRIERLWYDVTSGFGSKWKEFFLALEHNDELNPSLPSHIWLLHFLFRPAIHEDAQQGARGLNLRPRPNLDEDVGDVHQYGVDWSVHRDTNLMRHLRDHNPQDQAPATSFRVPEHMANVQCEPPNCPFTSDEMVDLRIELSRRVAAHVNRRDMPSRRIVWCHAFDIASEITARRQS